MRNCRLYHRVAFTLFCLILIGSAPLSAQEKGEWNWPEVKEGAEPRVEAIDPIYDFGKVYRGEMIEHTFTIHNVGDAPLAIKGVQRDCGCTGATITKESLAPGEEMEIEVILNTSNLEEGDLEKSVRIQTDDPGEPETILTMAGELRVTARMEPTSVELKEIDPWSKVPEQYVTITPVEGYDLEIKDLEIDSDLITAKLLGRDDSGVYRIAVQVNSETMKNVISATVKANTNLDEEPVLRIPVRVLMSQPYVIVPPTIRFSGIKPEYEGKLTYKVVIRNKQEKPLKILDIKSDSEFLEYALVTLEDGMKYRLKVMLVPGFPTEGFTGKLTVYTDNELYPEREIVVEVNRPKKENEKPEEL